MHAPAPGRLMLCNPNLVGASCRRVASAVTCMECIVLES